MNRRFLVLFMFVMLVSVVGVVGDLDDCLNAELHDLKPCSTNGLSVGDFCYDLEDNGFIYEIVKNDYGSSITNNPHYDYKNAKLNYGCELFSIGDYFYEAGGDPDDNSAGEEGDKYVFYQRVKERIDNDFSCNGNVINSGLDYSCKDLKDNGLSYNFCYSEDDAKLYYYDGGYLWYNAYLNSNCQLEKFDSSFMETGDNPSADETSGQKGDLYWYYLLLKEASQTYLGGSVITPNDELDVSSEDPVFLFQKNPSSGDFYNGYWLNEGDKYFWYNIEGTSDVKTGSYGYCEERYSSSSTLYCNFNYFEESDGVFTEASVYTREYVEKMGYSIESDYLSDYDESSSYVSTRGETNSGNNLGTLNPGSSYTQQGCDDATGVACKEIDEVWQMLYSQVGLSGSDVYWKPESSTGGMMVTWETLYPVITPSTGNYASSFSSSSCSYFNVGEPYGASGSSNSNEKIGTYSSGSRAENYIDSWIDNMNQKGVYGKTWVGKLNSNGPSDNSGLSESGRLNVVFIPSTTNLNQDYELMYLFHGLTGFCGGFNGCYSGTNDFGDRYASQLKSMSEKGRNIVFVLPELPWSAGDENVERGGSMSGSFNLVNYQTDVIELLKGSFGATVDPSFVSMVGHSAGGGALQSIASSMGSLTIKPNKITFSDADYSGSTNSVYNYYVKNNPDVELNLIVCGFTSSNSKSGARTTAHDPTRYSIDFVKSLWTEAESSWSYVVLEGTKYNYLSSLSTPGAEMGKILKIPGYNNINYLPYNGDHYEIATMSLAFEEKDYSLLCEGSGSSGVSGSNGNLDTSQLTDVGSGHILRSDAARDFLNMEKAYGQDIKLTSSYRVCGSPGDYDQGVSSQWYVWEKNQFHGGPTAAEPSPNTASAWNAASPENRICTSNHGLGIAIDVTSDAARQWVQQNGCNYGWWWGEATSEDWHFTYNSVDNDPYNSGKCSMSVS